ncbi:MAG: antitoxin [Planctomycetes bacterium]|nr:antitoxin [Planctomycetota bacterium]
MNRTVSVTELVRNFSDYLNRVTYRGEGFTLVRGKKPVAELRPVPRGVKVKDLAAVLRSLPHLTREEAEAFGRDIEEGRAALRKERPRDPWES